MLNPPPWSRGTALHWWHAGSPCIPDPTNTPAAQNGLQLELLCQTYAGFQSVCSYTHQFALLEPLGVIHGFELTPLVRGSTTKWRGNTEINGSKSFSSWPFRILAAVHTICASSVCIFRTRQTTRVFGAVSLVGANVAAFEPHEPGNSKWGAAGWLQSCNNFLLLKNNILHINRGFKIITCFNIF